MPGGEQSRSTPRDINSLTRRVERLERKRPDVGVPIRRGGGGISPFDAIIDPDQGAADAAAYRYQNLTDLVANESWDGTYQFVAGMISRPGTPVTETGAVTVPGPLAIRALGFQSTTGGWSIGSRAVWHFDGIVTVPNGILLEGIECARIASSTQARFFTGEGFFLNCIVNCLDGALTTRKVTNPCSGQCSALYTAFIDALFIDTLFAEDCIYYAGLSGNRDISEGPFHWDGGLWVNGSNSGTFTFDGGDEVYFRIGRVFSVFSTSGSGTPTFAFSNDSEVYFDFNAQQNPANVSVGAGVDNAIIRGRLNTVTVVGATDRGHRDVSCTIAGTADITGPATIRLVGSTAASRVILRGPGIRGDVQLFATSGAPIPGIDFIGCDDSLITATLYHDGAGTPGTSKPYAIDANSDRSILVVSGANAGWGAAGTNASGTSIARDESTF